MTQHITQEQALELVKKANNEWAFTSPQERDMGLCNAAIQHCIDQQAKELPVLPAQVSARLWIGPHWVEGNEMQYVYSEDGDGEPLYTDKQLQAYGAACATHAREMAISETVSIAYGYADNLTWNDSFKAEIKALKGK